MAKPHDSLRLVRCRTFVKKILPGAFGLKRRKINIWDVYPKEGHSSPLDYGFSLEDAWAEAAVRLGMEPIKKPVKEWWQR